MCRLIMLKRKKKKSGQTYALSDKNQFISYFYECSCQQIEFEVAPTVIEIKKNVKLFGSRTV